MAGWNMHTGQAVVLALENVDTDQLIPARFMSIPRSEGYGNHLLHDLRRNDDGTLRKDLPLNETPSASILIAGRNFGCGSSREAAVYALVDAGFRAVLAPSFGDIFAGNAVNNGLLPAQVSEETLAALMEMNISSVQIDLESKTIAVDNQTIDFALDATRQTKLINGWDDIDLTLAESDKISAYRSARATESRWLWPDVR